MIPTPSGMRALSTRGTVQEDFVDVVVSEMRRAARSGERFVIVECPLPLRATIAAEFRSHGFNVTNVSSPMTRTHFADLRINWQV